MIGYTGANTPGPFLTTCSRMKVVSETTAGSKLSAITMSIYCRTCGFPEDLLTHTVCGSVSGRQKTLPQEPDNF